MPAWCCLVSPSQLARKEAAEADDDDARRLRREEGRKGGECFTIIIFLIKFKGSVPREVRLSAKEAPPSSPGGTRTGGPVLGGLGTREESGRGQQPGPSSGMLSSREDLLSAPNPFPPKVDLPRPLSLPRPRQRPRRRHFVTVGDLLAPKAPLALLSLSLFLSFLSPPSSSSCSAARARPSARLLLSRPPSLSRRDTTDAGRTARRSRCLRTKSWGGNAESRAPRGGSLRVEQIVITPKRGGGEGDGSSVGQPGRVSFFFFFRPLFFYSLRAHQSSSPRAPFV